MFSIEDEIRELNVYHKKVDYLTDIESTLDSRFDQKYMAYDFARNIIMSKCLDICNDNWSESNKKQLDSIKIEIDSLINISIALCIDEIESERRLANTNDEINMMKKSKKWRETS